MARAAPCTTDLDCSLNGVCGGDGECLCDAPWKDSNDRRERCSILDVLPHPDNYVPAYGGPRTDTVFQKQNVTSWGGSMAVSYTHLRAHETPEHLVCRLLLEKKKNKKDT
eukprot:TRINITY_DN49575_c0_g1_i1.p2 TRINITY_DN49575_c0_g1~~TRINITY_DN49575_c0_g1_i1.p2  ORF type:complete len:110 (+),score=24.07 TRINITY_DN49575_c0_g1_i1:246-575(+)